MVEKEKRNQAVWLPCHSREARLRWSLGQSFNEIAARMDWHPATISKHAQLEGLDVPISRAEQIALINEISLDRAMRCLLDIEPGAAAETRLLARLNDFQTQEDDMKTRAAIGEMSDDELRRYVASLVPGLETKAAMADEPRGDGADERVSVPAVGTTRAEAASGRDKLA